MHKKIFQTKMVKPAVYTVGSTCLAKVKGYPPWPAIVKDIQPGTDRDGSFPFFSKTIVSL